jgi:hypothetical protein
MTTHTPNEPLTLEAAMSYTRKIDYNGFSSSESVTTDASGRVLSRSMATDYGADGVTDNFKTTSCAYDAAGVLMGEHVTFDTNGDGLTDFEQFRSLQYDGFGRMILDRVDTGDGDGNGVADNSSVTAYTFDSFGNLTVEETRGYVEGFEDPTSYRRVDTSYTQEGWKDVTLIDDAALYDFVVGEDCDYDSTGRMISIDRMDPFVWADEGWHRTDTWLFDDANAKIIYAGQHFVTRTTVTQVSSSHTKELVEYIGPAEDVYKRDLIETWRNADGLVTDRLTSHDGNLDGKFTPGSKSGYLDGRDRERFKYADLDGDGANDDVISHTIDYGLDKIIDYSEVVTFDPLVA